MYMYIIYYTIYICGKIKSVPNHQPVIQQLHMCCVLIYRRIPECEAIDLPTIICLFDFRPFKLME